jgi:hypothetical protein
MRASFLDDLSTAEGSRAANARGISGNCKTCY